ncbi:helix-turn-helix transcriptional regulator [Candidatus Thiothrix sp. Deng01]|uniref:Helix-turn-helix transcriptional regulator n=1 Tax=Candidatus Thiothrix phosphatis TaxID=3112415 RepID=A0ABU6D2I8_9GAMM|nr:helix-turn-helix transcriptional regulator [Candidatus Thiothrix sp. Deng01]MEB4593263.1 helix-turn-helix transcriptional regulator [Candidatus Thiothrix sp. Deng01]
MDRRYKPLSPVEQLQQRIALLGQIQQQPDMPLEQVVRQLRTGLHLTVAEYARLTGVAARTIQAIEAGTANPSVNTIYRLLQPFGLTLGVVAAVARDGQTGQ